MEQQGSRFARRDFFSVFVVGMSIARVSVVAARAVAAAEAEEDHLGSRCHGFCVADHRSAPTVTRLRK
jgi:hypothetical protein